MAGAASQAGDADSSRAPGLNFGLQGSVNVNLGALSLTVHQFFLYFAFELSSGFAFLTAECLIYFQFKISREHLKWWHVVYEKPTCYEIRLTTIKSDRPKICSAKVFET